MRKNKGQALIEFILIMPIFLIILLSIIDYGNILYQKYQLENATENVIELYRNDNDLEINNIIEKEKISLDINSEDEYTKFTFQKNVKILSPGLTLVLGQNYKIISERIIYSEA